MAFNKRVTMALTDKIKWNEKHKQSKIPPTPLESIINYSKLATGKQALDIACGMGRHSKYLALKGFSVDALDISSEAINSLQNIENITAKEVDFDTYHLEKEKYDLIVCTYFLDREIIKQMFHALKPKGIVIMETFLHHSQNERDASNGAFLLNEGELEDFFDKEYEILDVQEYWDKDYRGYKTMKGSIVARKKSGGMSEDDFWA